jgi:Uma2 family endonuclease
MFPALTRRARRRYSAGSGDPRQFVIDCLSEKTVVWVVYPISQIIEIHAPGQAVQIINNDGTLEGGDVLPGFKLAVREIFEQTGG